VLRRWLSIVAVLSLAVLALVVCDATAVALVTIFVSLAVVFAPASLPAHGGYRDASRPADGDADAGIAGDALRFRFLRQHARVSRSGRSPSRKLWSNLYSRGVSTFADLRDGRRHAGIRMLSRSGRLRDLGSGAMDRRLRRTSMPQRARFSYRSSASFWRSITSTSAFDTKVSTSNPVWIAQCVAGVAGEPAYAPTAYLSGAQRALVARFLERRDGFSASRRDALAARLAQPARQRVPPELQGLDDESLLERL
jgi:hypothetical protein